MNQDSIQKIFQKIKLLISDVDEELFFKNDIHHLVATLAQAKARNVACKISRKYIL